MNFARQQHITNVLGLISGMLMFLTIIFMLIVSWCVMSYNYPIINKPDISYGSYLGAYDLYMEVYGVTDEWKEIYDER